MRGPLSDYSGADDDMTAEELFGDSQDAITDARIRGAMRHPASVTIERLGSHSERWSDLFTPKELTALTLVMRALGAIERGER